MDTQHTRKIGQRPAAKPVSRMDTLRDTWSVIKPFVHFSVKAIKVIAHGLIFIVKHVPKPGDHKEKNDSGKVVKI
jgi:hypothetical protein